MKTRLQPNRRGPEPGQPREGGESGVGEITPGVAAARRRNAERAKSTLEGLRRQEPSAAEEHARKFHETFLKHYR
jgi:hypothetical protein